LVTFEAACSPDSMLCTRDCNCSLVTFEAACSPDSMLCTGDCNYSLVTFEAACSPDSMLCTRDCNYSLVTFEAACSPDSMLCTRDCNCSFMYMYSNLAVNKYLHTVASRWISSTYKNSDFFYFCAALWYCRDISLELKLTFQNFTRMRSQ